MTESFKQFIVEAVDRETDIDRIIMVIQKRMPAMLNSKIYRFGGKDGIENLTGGAKGYLYFFGSGKAFRVRVRKNHIEGFDIWRQYTLDGRPDFTVRTEDASVAQVAAELKKIAAVIKTPKAGNIELTAVKESISVEFDDVLFEAKGVSPEQFLELAKKTLGDVDMANVSWDQIVRVAKDNNVAVPNKKYLDGQKVGRGKWTLIPGGATKAGNGTANVEAGSTPSKDGGNAVLYIKVTAQDPVTKKFLPTADNKEAQALYKQIQGAISNDREPTKEELRDVDSLYGDLYRLVTLACRNKVRALLIYGGPGTGKTFTIMKAIQEAGLVKGKDYVKLSGKASALEIYKTLFMFRKGGMVLFDDLDSMWKDKDASNYLKAALDTSPVREISSLSRDMQNLSKMSDVEREEYCDRFDQYLAGEDVDEEDEGDEDEEVEKKAKKKTKMKFPSTFDFKGRVVFISNLKKDEFDTAILSRANKIDMSLTPEETLKRMRSILPELGGTDVSVDIKEELIQELLRLHGSGELEMVTMREFSKGLDIVRSGDPDWKSLVRYA